MFYPVQVRVEGELCVVVGGGAVASRKAKSLRDAGARVRVVAPRVDARIGRLGVEVRRKRFGPNDIRGARLVIAATSEEETNRAVARACGRRGIPVNVADRPELCTFLACSVVRRGPVTFAISTDGASPGLAKALRRELEKLYPASLAKLARAIERERRRVRKGKSGMRERMCAGAAIAGPEILKAFRAGGAEKAIRMVRARAKKAR